jgi:hypothetical protein
MLKGKSIHIEKLGIKIELSLLQVEFSDLITSSSDISFNRKIKLGIKSFEIQDLSLYADSPAERPSNIAQRNYEAYNNNEDPLY